MIQAIFKMKNNQIVEYEVLGHANYAPIGSDIVCAAVSSLVIAITNELAEVSLTGEVDTDGLFVRLVEVSERTDALTKTLYNGLTSIAEQYPKNLSLSVDTEMS